MRRIEAFQTADGVIHATQRAAHKHADDRLGAEITKHAHALRGMKYTDCLDYLENNADALATIAALKRDRDTLETDD